MSTKATPPELVTNLKTPTGVDLAFIEARLKDIDPLRFQGQALQDELQIYADLLWEYLALHLNLPVSDTLIHGLCKVLTDRGFITYGSCEGHGQHQPVVFYCVQVEDYGLSLTEFLYLKSRNDLGTQLGALVERRDCLFKYPWQTKLSGRMKDEKGKYLYAGRLRIDVDIHPNPERFYPDYLTDLDLLALEIMREFPKQT